ncbi:MAG: DMT family transporter [Chloroflexota bacterium]|nr:DMT family transporter [Chloroflexota bacterium]
MPQAIGVLLAIMLGAGGALQVGLLGAMSRQRGAIESTWVSILGTVFALSLVLAIQAARGVALTLPSPFTSWPTFGLLAMVSGILLGLAVAGLPIYFVVTGLLAAPYLIGASYLVPRLGVGLFLGSIIAGQLIGGLVIDHLGAFGTAARPIDLVKLGGVAALLLGVVLIRGLR